MDDVRGDRGKKWRNVAINLHCDSDSGGSAGGVITRVLVCAVAYYCDTQFETLRMIPGNYGVATDWPSMIHTPLPARLYLTPASTDGQAAAAAKHARRSVVPSCSCAVPTQMQTQASEANHSHGPTLAGEAVLHVKTEKRSRGLERLPGGAVSSLACFQAIYVT